MQPSDTHAFFASIPWCSRLLAQPGLRIHAPSSRTPKPSTTEDSLFAETLRSTRTVSAALAFYPRPAASDAHVGSAATLLALGDGLNGHPAVLHGGVVAAVLDEAMGVLLSVDADLAHVRAVATGHAVGEHPDGIGAYTAELNVRYLLPVRTPGVLLARARVVRREGRKIWIRAVVSQKSGQATELDGQMLECAVGEALFVEPRSGRL
ncbi:hypothetical protein MBLNU459_g5397t1 [Dothideomycetes sp. NU459]